jgi:prevent-host-death family protein
MPVCLPSHATATQRNVPSCFLQKSLNRKTLTLWSGLVRLYKNWQEGGMHITNISEAKAQLSALIEKVIGGHEVIIGKAGKPVAKLVRYERSQETRQPGALRGRIKIAEDFDELPDDIAEAFGIIEK